MARLLLEATREAEICKDRATAWASVTAPPLTPPPSYPGISIADLPYLAVSRDTTNDEHLTSLLCESGFDLSAGIIDGAFYIDSHDKFRCYAIGARLDLLERRCGAGWYLLNLLATSPIPMWMPDDLYEHAEEYFSMDLRKSTASWVHKPPPNVNKQKASKRRLPKNLRNICTQVEKVGERAMQLRQIGEYPDRTGLGEEYVEIPAILLTWWDNVHWHNKRTIDNPSMTIERGTNPAFALMDSFAEQTMQTGEVHMGSGSYHDLDVVREIVETAKPYAKLLNYLKHDEQESGFNCFF